MTIVRARSPTARSVWRAISALAFGLPLAALPGLAQAMEAPVMPVYLTDLDTSTLWGGSPSMPTTLDQITQEWGGAGMNGTVVRSDGTLLLNDSFNPGSTFYEPVSVGARHGTFAFEYTFTVGSLQNPAGTFVSSFGGLSHISLALYQGAPSLYQVAPVAGTNPQGATTAPLDVGVLSMAGSTAGEYVLQMAGLTAGPTYYLTVTGKLEHGVGSGNFFGLAEVSPVPLPGALAMFGSAIAGLAAIVSRRRLGDAARKLARGAGLAAAILGLGAAALVPGAARAATYTDEASVATFPPPSGGPSYVSLLALIRVNLSNPNLDTLDIPGTPVVSAPKLTAFKFDYLFDLTAPTVLKAAISQSNTNVITGSQFELFGGTPGSPSALPLASAVIGAGPSVGQLVLSYAGPHGSGMAPGEYFLTVMGAPLAGQTHAALSGTMQLMAVPVPGALLLFGSAIGGLAIVEWIGKGHRPDHHMTA